MFECNCGKIFEKQKSRSVHRKYCNDFQNLKNIEIEKRIANAKECPVCKEKVFQFLTHLEKSNDELHKILLNTQKNIAKIIFEKGFSEYQRKEEGFIFSRRTLWKFWREFFDENTIKSVRKKNKYKKKTFICRMCGEKYNVRQTLGICQSCLQQKYKNYQCLKCGKSISLTKYGYCEEHYMLSEEYHKNMSIALRGKSGGYRKGGGRSKGGYYKTFYFDSLFEVEVAKFFDENNINWIRNTKRFYFEWKNKKTYYIPDFYFPDKNLYLETKGYYWGDKRLRTLKAVEINQLKWIDILQKEWKNKKYKLLQFIKSNY